MSRSVDLDLTLDLVTEALRLSTRSGLSQVLRRIAESVRADGCVLWQEYRNQNDPTDARLFTLGQWFEGPHVHGLYDIPVDGSATGLALQTQHPVFFENRWNDPRVLHADAHLDHAQVTSFCAIPITFDNKVRGTLNAYWRDRQHFEHGEAPRLELLGRLVPQLYESINDRVRVDLVDAMTGFIANPRQPHNGESEAAALARVQEICVLVSDRLEAIETSVFLEGKPGEYTLRATTWEPAYRFRQSYSSAGDGLTSRVLRNRLPLKLFDLENFDQDRPAILRQYPDLSFRHAKEITEAVRIAQGLAHGPGGRFQSELCSQSEDSCAKPSARPPASGSSLPSPRTDCLT